MKTTFHFMIVIAISMATSLPIVAYAKDGVESGGGGGVANVGLSYPVLLDYFTIINSVEKLPISSELPSRIKANSSFSINENNQDQITHSNAAYAKAFGILNDWENLPYARISTLVEAAFKGPLNWNFTDKKISAPPFYLAPSLPEDAITEVAAYYSKKDSNVMKVSISRSIWNQMQLRDQAGLLIHEALRQVQIGLNVRYSDEALQRATAIYLLCRPSARLNYYMFYLINNSPILADKIYGSFNALIESECRALE